MKFAKDTGKFFLDNLTFFSSRNLHQARRMRMQTKLESYVNHIWMRNCLIIFKRLWVKVKLGASRLFPFCSKRKSKLLRNARKRQNPDFSLRRREIFFIFLFAFRNLNDSQRFRWEKPTEVASQEKREKVKENDKPHLRGFIAWNVAAAVLIYSLHFPTARNIKFTPALWAGTRRLHQMKISF